MIAYCVNCGASIVTEIFISNGEIKPGNCVRCPNCGKMAGIKSAPGAEPAESKTVPHGNEQAKNSSLADLVDKKNSVTIKDGKIS